MFFFIILERNDYILFICQTSEEEAEGGEGEEGKEEEQVVYKYIPPEPKEWVSLGSEKEIEEESVTTTRKTVSCCKIHCQIRAKLWYMIIM